jgi:hypothetical protein
MTARSTLRDPGQGDGAAALLGQFSLLLVLIICAYLLSAFVAGRWVNAVQVLLFTGAVLLALRNVPVICLKLSGQRICD